MIRGALQGRAACSSCRYEVLRSFLSISDVPIRLISNPTPRAPIRIPSTYTPVKPHRFFSTANRAENTAEENRNETDEYDTPEAEASLSPSAVTAVPWYLQVETPKLSSQHPLAARQAIPELPENPPPILEALLQHLSVEIGLDDLSLLDLRSLDPPPALGANLLMILGTARSAKHLNVSADRFCRWLRTNHKLRPFADGLLGRNELKIKLRRKARRAKLANSVGSTVDSNRDDGITTGWICVNIGTIPGGEEFEEDTEPIEGFAGFGQRSQGPQVVVQMLTEEKRSELDLESLWDKRIAKREARSQEMDELHDENVELDATTPETGLAARAKTEANMPSSLSGIEFIRQRMRALEQRRAFHTTERRRYPESVTSDQSQPNNHVNFEEVITESSERRPSDDISFQEVFDASHDPQNHSSPSETFPSGSSVTFTKNGPARNADLSAYLNGLLNHLEGLQVNSRDEAIRILGSGVSDKGSSLFLKNFYDSVSQFDGNRGLEYHFGLVCRAIKMKHPDYHKKDLIALYQSMKGTTHEVSAKSMEEILETLVIAEAEPYHTRSTSEEAFQSSNIDHPGLDLALALLPHVNATLMSDYQSGLIAVIDTEIDLVQTHLTQLDRVGTSRGAVQDGAFRALLTRLAQLQLAQTRLEDHAVSYASQLSKNSGYADKLKSLASDSDWTGFWYLWRGIALKMESRPSELYALLFSAIARKGIQWECREVISYWAPMMEREEPPAALNIDVARALMDCLRVAQPGIEKMKHKAAPYPKLWQECEAAVQMNSQGLDSMIDI